MVGFDTGFFLRLVRGHPRAGDVWLPVAAGEQRAVVSCVSFFELDRLALRGALDRRSADGLLEDIPALCTVVWLGPADGPDRLRRAARLAHRTGLSMADALILSALLDAGAETVYTTDADAERAGGSVRIVVL